MRTNNILLADADSITANRIKFGSPFGFTPTFTGQWYYSKKADAKYRIPRANFLWVSAVGLT